MQTLWIGLAGALGTVARYRLDTLVQGRLQGPFPCGTLLVNLLDSLLGAVLLYSALRGGSVSPAARLVLGTGFLGGFTTYSAFNSETLGYFLDGAPGRGAVYLAATLLGCLAAGGAGWLLARALFAT